MSDSSFINHLNKLNWIFKLPIYISSVVFIIYATISIFNLEKNIGEDTLLNMIPMSKQKIFASKVLSTLIMIAFSSIAWFILSFLGSYIDINVNSFFRFKYSSSILIGNIIVSLFFSSVTLFISNFTKDKALIIYVSIVGVTLPIATLVNNLTMTSSFVGERRFASYSSNGNNVNTSIDKIYSVERMKDDSFQRNAFEQFHPEKYKITSKFDLYSHMNILYSLFYFDSNSNYFIRKSKETINSGFSLTIDGKEYVMLLEKALGTPSSWSSKYKAISNNLMEIIEKNKIKIESYSIERQIYFISQLLKSATTNISKQDKVNNALLSTDNEKNSDEFIYRFQSINPTMISLLHLFNKHGISTSEKSEFQIIKKIAEKTLPSILLVEVGTKINTFKHIPYINKAWMIISWSLVSIALFFISFIIKLRSYQYKS
ncbi:MAG: ABC-2 transporter permease [Mycoplasmataceae bacterium]|nr:ABC-2 transporter permease [Mycoplasmataceae bacterium]